MENSRVVPSLVSGLQTLVGAGVLLCILGWSTQAESPAGLLPPFSGKGWEFSKTAKGDHHVKGWLPKDWVDNSSWAPVSATYTKLADSPDKDLAAVRIEVEKVEDHQLQLTTFEGNHDYKAGATYVVTGWVRSPLLSAMTVGFREEDEPHDFYSQKELVTGEAWKRFEYTWTPEKDCIAWLMFISKKPGTVDLAGITVVEKP